MDDPSDLAALVLAARRGDRAAFSRLVERFLAAVTATALAVVRDRDHAEDVAQIAFTRAWQNLRGLKADAAFASWLMTIARNTARNWLRDHAAAPKLGADALNAVAAPAATERDIPEVVFRLPESLREVILLRYVSDLSYEEIADAIGEPLSIVRDRLYRAKIALQEILK